MTNQDKWLLGLRAGMLLSYIVMAFVTAFIISIENSVRAPLLTLMGTSSLILVLIPANLTITNIGAIVGTAIVMGGSGAWFVDATQENSSFEYWLFRITVVGTLIFVASSLILSIRRARLPKPSRGQSGHTNRKKSIIVFATLILTVLVLRVIRSSRVREKRDDTVGQFLLE